MENHPLYKILSKTSVFLCFLACALTSQLWIGYTVENAQPSSISTDLLKIQTLAVIQPSIVREITTKWSSSQEEAFRRHFILDMYIHPMLYSLLFMSWVSYEARVRKAALSYWVYSLLLLWAAIPGVCDVAENSIHFALTVKGFGKTTDEEARLASIFALTKWILVLPLGFRLLYLTVSRKLFFSSTTSTKTKEKTR